MTATDTATAVVAIRRIRWVPLKLGIASVLRLWSWPRRWSWRPPATRQRDSVTHRRIVGGGPSGRSLPGCPRPTRRRAPTARPVPQPALTGGVWTPGRRLLTVGLILLVTLVAVRGAGGGDGDAPGRAGPRQPRPLRLGVQRLLPRQPRRHRRERSGLRPHAPGHPLRHRPRALRGRAPAGRVGDLDADARRRAPAAGTRRRRAAGRGLRVHRAAVPARVAAAHVRPAVHGVGGALADRAERGGGRRQPLRVEVGLPRTGPGRRRLWRGRHRVGGPGRRPRRARVAGIGPARRAARRRRRRAAPRRPRPGDPVAARAGHRGRDRGRAARLPPPDPAGHAHRPARPRRRRPRAGPADLLVLPGRRLRAAHPDDGARGRGDRGWRRAHRVVGALDRRVVGAGAPDRSRRARARWSAAASCSWASASSC